MNTIILLFFALPIATIILAIVLQKILKCPTLVAATFFAIYLVLTFIISSNLLIFAIAYTIIAYVTAVIVRLICNIRERLNRCEDRCDNDSREGNLRIRCGGSCICDDDSERGRNNNLIPRNCGRDSDNSNDGIGTRFTLTTNQINPVVCLTSRNNSSMRRDNNSMRRNNCCCGRR